MWNFLTQYIVCDEFTDALPGTTTSETSSERDSPFVSETVSLASEASSMRGESSLASETSSLRETSPEAQPSMMPPPPPPASSAVSVNITCRY